MWQRKLYRNSLLFQRFDFKKPKTCIGVSYKSKTCLRLGLNRLPNCLSDWVLIKWRGRLEKKPLENKTMLSYHNDGNAVVPDVIGRTRFPAPEFFPGTFCACRPQKRRYGWRRRRRRRTRRHRNEQLPRKWCGSCSLIRLTAESSGRVETASSLHQRLQPFWYTETAALPKRHHTQAPHSTQGGLAALCRIYTLAYRRVYTYINSSTNTTWMPRVRRRGSANEYRNGWMLPLWHSPIEPPIAYAFIPFISLYLKTILHHTYLSVRKGRREKKERRNLLHDNRSCLMKLEPSAAGCIFSYEMKTLQNKIEGGIFFFSSARGRRRRMYENTRGSPICT